MDRPHAPVGPVLKGRRDLELELGARAHFDDPAYYDASYSARLDDVAYYERLVEGCSSVLEYGIGNGRIALPIARRGTAVTGIDHSAAMLASLRERLKLESPAVQRRVRSRCGDMRSVRLGQRFPLVLCTFNTALHLYTRVDVERWLACVRAHLTPRGRLVVDLGVPVLEDLVRDPSIAYRTPAFRHPTLGRVNYWEHFDYDRVRQIQFVSMCFEPIPARGTSASSSRPSRPSDSVVMTPLAHRQFFPREFEALLHYNGFVATEVHGDFEGGPLTQSSDVMIWHARARVKGRS